MKKVNIRIIVGSIVAAIMIGGWYLLFANCHDAITTIQPGEIIRLHVIANSDSPVDQSVKLQVRDAIVEYLTPLLVSAQTPQQARDIVLEQQNTLLEIAKQVLQSEHQQYSAALDFGIFEFPIKSYGTMVFPAGQYEALRIKLGKSEGKNWWCVLFPPLCFIDGSNATAVPITKAAEQGSQAEIEFKLKILEIFK